MSIGKSVNEQPSIQARVISKEAFRTEAPDQEKG